MNIFNRIVIGGGGGSILTTARVTWDIRIYLYKQNNTKQNNTTQNKTIVSLHLKSTFHYFSLVNCCFSGLQRSKLKSPVTEKLANSNGMGSIQFPPL